MRVSVQASGFASGWKQSLSGLGPKSRGCPREGQTEVTAALVSPRTKVMLGSRSWTA